MLSPLLLSLALAQQPPWAPGERLVMTSSVKKKALAVSAGKGQLDGVQQSEFFEAADTQCRAGWTAEAAECVAAREQPCPALTAARRKTLDVRTQEIINR
jgi:hypothetical protein